MLSVLPLAVALAGCSATTDPTRHALNGSVAPAEAMTLPPPGGPAVVSVSQRVYSNAVQQDVILASDTRAPGQNRIRVQLFGPTGGDAGMSRLPDTRMAEASIGSELRAFFPGIRMQRSALYAQNAYGPFGYAVGRHASGDMCLYGWQRMTASQEAAPFSPRGSIQIRLRLCQRGASERSLLAVMHGYTINASLGRSGWQPYGGVPAPDPRVGQVGQQIYAQGRNWVDDMPEPRKPRADRAAARPAAARPAARPAELPLPPPGAPLVPPPPASTLPATQIPPPPPPASGPASSRREGAQGN